MVWDSEDDPPGLKNSPPVHSKPAVNSRDLEAIVSLLEIGALSLTPVAGREFTREELIAEAQKIAGPDFDLHEVDCDIVLTGMGYMLRKKSGKYSVR